MLTKDPRLIVLLAVVLAGCEFQPSGDHLIVLPQTDDSDMSIDLAAVANDTLFLYTRTVLSYKSIVGTKRIKYFRAYLNDQDLASNAAGDGTFAIEAKFIKNGFYTLRLEIHASSGNGSLADIYDKEDFHVARTWTVAIDNSMPDPVTFTTIQRKDGTLDINWNRYKKFNFTKYQIRKHPYNQGFGYYDNGWIKDITDINTTSLRDTTFIGGKVKYSIHVESDGQQSDWTEKPFEDALDLDVNATWLGKNRIRVTWRKTPYHKNFREYVINFSPADNDERLFTKNIVNDTSLIIDDVSVIFPGSRRIGVSAYPHDVNRGWSGFVYEYTELTLGEPFPNFTYPHIVYNAALNKYFAIVTHNNSILRIDGTTQKLEQSSTITDGRFFLSDNGQNLYITDGDLLKKLDAQTFAVTKTFDLSPYKGAGTVPWYISVSNTDLVTASNQITGSFIFDMSINALVQQLPFDLYTQLSPSGKYMLRKGKLWQWNGTQFAEVAAFVTTNWMSSFFKEDEKLIIAYAGTIKVMDLATFAFEKSILSQAFDVKYDPISDVLSGRSDDGPAKTYLYYASQDIPMPAFDSYWTVVLNNRLIAPGRFLPLSHHYP